METLDQETKEEMLERRKEDKQNITSLTEDIYSIQKYINGHEWSDAAFKDMKNIVSNLTNQLNVLKIKYYDYHIEKRRD